MVPPHPPHPPSFVLAEKPVDATFLKWDGVSPMRPILKKYQKPPHHGTQLWYFCPVENYKTIIHLIVAGFKLYRKVVEHRTRRIYVIYMIRLTATTPAFVEYAPLEHAYDACYILSYNDGNSDGMNFDTLKKSLEHRGLERTYVATKCPKLLYLEEIEGRGYNQRYYNTRCYLMNVLSNDKFIVADKYNLYQEMRVLFPKLAGQFMAESYTIMEFSRMIAKGINFTKFIYIAKPADSRVCSGKGIAILDSTDKLALFHAMVKKYNNVLVSQYIRNPLLFKGRKFHLRVFFVASIIRGVYRTYLLPLSKILTAKLPYVDYDFGNSEIHDTHFKSTDLDYFCPDDLATDVLPGYRTLVVPRMEHVFRLVSRILQPWCVPYPNAENAYEVFGCDILVQDDYSIKLLEINNHLSYVCRTEAARAYLSETLIGYLDATVLAIALDGKTHGAIKPLYESHKSQDSRHSRHSRKYTKKTT